MERIQMTIPGQYGGKILMVLPEVSDTDRIAAIIARAQVVGRRCLNTEGSLPASDVLVAEPAASAIDIQIVDGDGVMTRAQFLAKEAEFRDLVAKKARSEAVIAANAESAAA